MIIVGPMPTCKYIFISLSRSGAIRQDEIECWTFTILCVAFKANEEVNDAKRPLLNQILSRKLKRNGAVWSDAYLLWQPDVKIARDSPYPLGYTSIVELAHSLKLYHLVVVEGKIRNVDKRLGPRNS
jgi:hypothetical protein